MILSTILPKLLDLFSYFVKIFLTGGVAMLRKYTVLALLRIQTYARKNTLIFCLFLLGTVLSSLSLLFFYGNSMADKRNMGPKFSSIPHVHPVRR